MIFKRNKLFYGIFLVSLPSFLSADITTLQWWDPAPVFNAANLNMPPDAQFANIIKERIIEDSDAGRPRFGVNFSPFLQRAIRAQNSEGVNYGQYGLEGAYIPAGREMSDYMGTAYLMGLFLGKDANGNSIWLSGSDNGDAGNITTASVNATSLPSGLKEAVNQMNDNANAVGAVPGDNAIIYNVPTNPDKNSIPSIFSEGVLSQDETFFGAFSTPLIYQKSGLRWELNFDISDDFGLIIRGGLVQISQTANTPIELSTSESPWPNIYIYLNTVGNPSNENVGTSGITDPNAQANYNENVTNNLDYLLGPAANGGVDYNTDTFTKTGIEDFQFLLFCRHAFAIDPVNVDDYTPMIITPYAIFGYTLPFESNRDYSLLYSLPFGNNGHTSLGGTAGVTFDFIDSIEIGFEGGVTGFIKQEIAGVPCPNHELQRIIFPYRRDMYVTPGFNYHFAGIFNAVDFIKNTSFVFKYQFIQHTQDSIVQVTDSPYFFPYLLEYLTPWTSQMFTAALTFAIQPSTYLSVAWQGALSQNSAYVSNTIIGTLSFLF